MAHTHDIYLEIGKKKVIAVARDWPGWARGGRDEESALQALVDYAPRYARVMEKTGLGFQAPASAADLRVVERIEGNGTTDYGVPGHPLPGDARPVEPGELKHLKEALQACWQAFDKAVRAAEGKELRKGPRGGGRELEKIVEHVTGSAEGYLSATGGSLKNKDAPPEQAADELREAVLATVDASVRGEIAEKGPRGGTRWPARYFIRRLAWHILDHVWEIEDRVEA